MSPGKTAPKPKIVLHKNGRAVGLMVGAAIYTHNATLRAKFADWYGVAEEAVPERLRALLVAARVRAEKERGA